MRTFYRVGSTNVGLGSVDLVPVLEHVEHEDGAGSVRIVGFFPERHDAERVVRALDRQQKLIRVTQAAVDWLNLKTANQNFDKMVADLEDAIRNAQGET